MKKGFTLIELLAVIVILAIIALIATPIVLNIISDTRENAKVRSAELYLTAVEQAVLRKKMDDTSFNPSSCTITSGVVTCDVDYDNDGNDDLLQVEVDGNLPTSGMVTFNNGKVESYNLTIDGTTIVNGVIQEPAEEIVLSPGGTYTLKNGDEATIVATKNNIDNSSSMGYGDVIILTNGSEWYYLGTYEDKLMLLSKYNYILEGENAGEMDPSEAVNDVSLETYFPGESNIDELDFGSIINSINLKQKIVNSLGVSESDISIYYPDYTYSDSICYYKLNTPSFYYYEAGNQVCGDDSSVGLRVLLNIDSQYVDYVLSPNENIVIIDEYALIVPINSPLVINPKKVKETNEYIMFLTNNATTLSVRALNLNTNSFETVTEILGAKEAITELGYTYSCDETHYCAIDFSSQIEGVDKTVVEEFYSDISNGFVEDDDEPDILLIKVTK